MWTTVHSGLSAGLNPRPARNRTLVAYPLLPMEDAGCRSNIEPSFGACHRSRPGVTWDLDDLGRVLRVLAVGPWTRQLSVFVTMRRAGLHRSHITSVSIRKRGQNIIRSLAEMEEKPDPSRSSRAAHQATRRAVHRTRSLPLPRRQRPESDTRRESSAFLCRRRWTR